MTVFWVVAAALLFAALLFVLPPLLRPAARLAVEHNALNVTVYKDQMVELDRDLANKVISDDQYQRSKEELERRLLQDVASGDGSGAVAEQPARNTAIAIALLIPLVSVMLYQILGAPYAIVGQTAPVAMGGGSQGGAGGGASSGDQEQHPDGAKIEEMVAQLAARMQQEPDNMDGWIMLARSYRFLKRYNEAVAAFDKAMPIVSANAQLLADYADTMAMANNGNLDGKPIDMIKRAIALDPRNVQSLWLAGTYEFDKGNYAEAIQYWRRLRQTVPAGSEEAVSMDNNIAEAEARMKAAGQEVPPPPPELASASAPVATAVSGSVDLDPALKDKAAPTDTVFIFARALSGPKMPLAIVRKQVADLPLQFTLDETMAMMPAMSLANYSEVVVGARISKSGNAMPQSGDLEGLTNPVKVGATGLSITIKSVVP